MSLSQKIVENIIQLRRTGHSIPEISDMLHVPKSTISKRVRDIKILAPYRQRWLDRRNASKIMSDRNWIKARETADALFDKLTRKELVLIGVALYWAEGAKRDFTFSNTDARMVRFFVSTLKTVFQVANDDMKISLRIYEDLDKHVCLSYWSKITGINLKTRKTSIDVLRGRKQGKLQYGMCRIRVRKSGLLLKKFSAIIDKIAEETRPS